MTVGPRPEPPIDLLADLDAGLLDPAASAEVRALAADDPRAAAVLGALGATRADLAELADPPVPADVTARWDAALAAEQESRLPGGPVAPADPPRPPAPAGAVPEPNRTGDGPQPPRFDHPGRRRPWSYRPRPTLLAAAVLAAAVAGGVLWAPEAPAPLPIEEVDLVGTGLAVRGRFDVGDLADPHRRSGCLREAAPPGVAADAPLLGGRDVVLGGRPGVLLLLATGRLGQLDVVVVDPHCGPEGGTLLGLQRIGR
ncbi:hypothetical protein [Pseudonocardia sp. MH-G8]|uniref:hypothetical protein n=1 Tax=Pseudonocardia sp. MH-G8 TaxID=1854588 RepID=UPI000BA13BF6|nr:hypothetical protein [Pseudonocardia sp. MH-G8]OZM82434.1 hypothetical protein CFP66_11900 [Pseudonocardia sp. MH-G8]